MKPLHNPTGSNSTRKQPTDHQEDSLCASKIKLNKDSLLGNVKEQSTHSEDQRDINTSTGLMRCALATPSLSTVSKELGKNLNHIDTAFYRTNSMDHSWDTMGQFPGEDYYQHGFGNEHQTEAKLGALPRNQNNPQKAPFGLYTEQISGSAFTKLRAENLRTWAYRILPSVSLNATSRKVSFPLWQSDPAKGVLDDNPLRWRAPLQSKTGDVEAQLDNKNFIEGIFTFAVNDMGALHWYATDKSMVNTYFYNADAEMIIVPQQGSLKLKTEMGVLFLSPKEVAIIPAGIKFQADPVGEKSSGYIGESKTPFKLPELGPLGANGLAAKRHFQYPRAGYEKRSFDNSNNDTDQQGKLIRKSQHQFTEKTIGHSPLNVVAWQGNYAPYKYDLEKFNTINTVSFDHPDPSIFTVLTAPSLEVGKANIDFVIFPERWMVAEHTFRPPYFHENIMGEAMGSICGEYDAKPNGFEPGGVSIHNPWVPHGPEASVYENASSDKLKPNKLTGNLAFMFESCLPWMPTEQALQMPERDLEYLNCWSGFKPAEI